MRTASGQGNDARKILAFYRANYGISAPYEVLCDGPTIAVSFKNDVYLKHGLAKLLGGSTQVVVTDCVVKELRDLGEDFSGAAIFAKRAKRVPCAHQDDASASQCVAMRIKNPRETPLLLATSDHDVLKEIGQTPGVPLIGIANQTKLVLVAPTKSSLNHARGKQSGKASALSPADKALVDAAVQLEKEARAGRKKRKRKGPKGPNPLSVKKRKIEASTAKTGQIALASAASKSPAPKSAVQARSGTSEVPNDSESLKKETNEGDTTNLTEVAPSRKRKRKRKKSSQAQTLASTQAENIQQVSGIADGLDSENLVAIGKEKHVEATRILDSTQNQGQEKTGPGSEIKHNAQDQSNPLNVSERKSEDASEVCETDPTLPGEPETSESGNKIEEEKRSSVADNQGAGKGTVKAMNSRTPLSESQNIMPKIKDHASEDNAKTQHQRVSSPGRIKETQKKKKHRKNRRRRPKKQENQKSEQGEEGA